MARDLDQQKAYLDELIAGSRYDRISGKDKLYEITGLSDQHSALQILARLTELKKHLEQHKNNSSTTPFTIAIDQQFNLLVKQVEIANQYQKANTTTSDSPGNMPLQQLDNLFISRNSQISGIDKQLLSAISYRQRVRHDANNQQNAHPTQPPPQRPPRRAYRPGLPPQPPNNRQPMQPPRRPGLRPQSPTNRQPTQPPPLNLSSASMAQSLGQNPPQQNNPPTVRMQPPPATKTSQATATPQTPPPQQPIKKSSTTVDDLTKIVDILNHNTSLKNRLTQDLTCSDIEIEVKDQQIITHGTTNGQSNTKEPIGTAIKFDDNGGLSCANPQKGQCTLMAIVAHEQQHSSMIIAGGTPEQQLEGAKALLEVGILPNIDGKDTLALLQTQDPTYVEQYQKLKSREDSKALGTTQEQGPGTPMANVDWVNDDTASAKTTTMDVPTPHGPPKLN